MPEQNYVFTKDCRFRQQLTLGSTGFIALVTIVDAFFDHSFWTWIASLILIAVMVAVNFLAAILYKIRKEGQTFVVENVWRRSVFPVESLVEIRLVKFILPYPFNPYVKFIFTNGKSYQGVIPLAAIVYLRTGIDRYLEDLREQWLARSRSL
jgi:hypothetical protein